MISIFILDYIVFLNTFRPRKIMSLRERTKVLRGFDGAEGVEVFCDGMRTYYNYIRPHQGIGRLTPAQIANIPINLMGSKWEKIIGLAGG